VLLLFFASFGGLAYFGFLGLFLGPILLAVVLETFAIYREQYQQGQDELRDDLIAAREMPGKPL